MPDEISIALPDYILKRLQELASETGNSIEELVEQSLHESLEQPEATTD